MEGKGRRGEGKEGERGGTWTPMVTQTQLRRWQQPANPGNFEMAFKVVVYMHYVHEHE